ncbi:hypothetical protein HDU76_003071, partial [Blyttiomyces sp. JEL0837]
MRIYLETNYGMVKSSPLSPCGIGQQRPKISTELRNKIWQSMTPIKGFHQDQFRLDVFGSVVCKELNKDRFNDNMT